jgi:hypothetical protein
MLNFIAKEYFDLYQQQQLLAELSELETQEAIVQDLTVKTKELQQELTNLSDNLPQMIQVNSMIALKRATNITEILDYQATTSTVIEQIMILEQKLRTSIKDSIDKYKVLPRYQYIQKKEGLDQNELAELITQDLLKQKFAKVEIVV